MASCKFCKGTGWVDIRVIPVGGEDFGPVNQDADPCVLCNPDGSTEDYFSLSDEIKDNIPYYCASPIGGYEGQWGMFENFNEHGQLLRSVLVSRAVCNYTSWQPPLPIEDCPVCLGWGIWSNNGQILDCIACGGQPIEARCGYDPLHAYWLRKVGPGAMYLQRGRPESTCLSTAEMLHHLEMMPGVTRIN